MHIYVAKIYIARPNMMKAMCLNGILILFMSMSNKRQAAGTM